MSFYDLVVKRFSARCFSDKMVSDEDINKIIECGRLSPTAKNLQPDIIYVIKSDYGMSKLKKVCNMTYNAPICLMVCADKNVSWKNELEDGYDSYEMDATIVATHMMLEATDLGINSVWVRMFNSKDISKEYDLPSNIVPVCLIMLGYIKNGFGPSKLHDIRKNINEIVGYL